MKYREVINVSKIFSEENKGKNLSISYDSTTTAIEP